MFQSHSKESKEKLFKGTQPGSTLNSDLDNIVEKLNAGLGPLLATVQENKNESAKRYLEAKSQIRKEIKRQDYWPEGMTHPNKFRKFYLADDMSYCGFGTSQDRKKAS